MIINTLLKLAVVFLASSLILLSTSLFSFDVGSFLIAAEEYEDEKEADDKETTGADEPAIQSPEPGDTESEDYLKERRRLLRELDPDLAPGDIIETPIGPKRYRIQLGMFSRYESDVFVDQEEEQGDEFRTTPSIKFEYDMIRKGESVLTGKAEVEYNIVSNGGNDENYFEFKAGFEYEFGKNGIELKYTIAPDQFSTISDGNEIRQTDQELDATYARSLTRKLSLRTEYQLDYENHSIENDRNNYENQFGGDVRYKFSDILNPGVGFEIEVRNSNRSNDERWGWSPYLLLNSKINNRIWSRFRYLYGSRSYTTEDVDDGNFGRGDIRNEIRDNISIRLTRQWWLNIFAEYRKLDSSREGRDTNKIEIGMGIFFRFP